MDKENNLTSETEKHDTACPALEFDHLGDRGGVKCYFGIFEECDVDSNGPRCWEIYDELAGQPAVAENATTGKK